MDPRPAARKKSLRDITREWDAAASIRADQLESGRDLSFTHVLLPVIDALRAGVDQTRVLDAGCGTGYLTEHLARTAQTAVGVDISGRSIKLARDRQAAPNVSYVKTSVESFARTDQPRFTLVVANMVLTTVPDLRRFVSAVSALLAPGGRFIFTVPHPWFWPAYWGYARAPWFEYLQEIAVEAPFRISFEHTSVQTTHFHRPLEMYSEALRAVGLVHDVIREPMPLGSESSQYLATWEHPRFLAMRTLQAA